MLISYLVKSVFHLSLVEANSIHERQYYFLALINNATLITDEERTILITYVSTMATLSLSVISHSFMVEN